MATTLDFWLAALRLDFWTTFVSFTWIFEACGIATFCAYFFLLTRLDRYRLREQGLLSEQRKKAIAILARSAANRGLWALISLWAGLQGFIHPEAVHPVSLATGVFAIALQTVTLVLTVLDYRARVIISQGGWRI